MEGEQSSSRELPKHLVENIIARVPFPSIFKARTLSKAWLARFSSMEFHEEDGKASMSSVIAAKFQTLVTERSDTWEICGPVCICYDHDECHAGKVACRPSYENCYAYNPARQTWQKIPSMSFIAGSFAPIVRKFFTIEGALVFVHRSDDAYYGGPRRRSASERLYVANMLTESCKLLPSRPLLEKEEEILLSKIVINTSSQTYKVVLFIQTFIWNPPDFFNERSADAEFWVQIFDSMSCSWRNKKLVGVPNHNNWSLSGAVHINGVLYMVAGRGSTHLIAFDMEEETLTELSIGNAEHSIHGRYAEFIHHLVVCDGDLFIICSKGTFRIGSDLFIRVLKADLSSGTLSVVAEGPPRTFNLKSVNGSGQPVGYSGCIYFWVEKDYRAHSIGRMPVYNVRENCWSCISSCPDAFYTGCCFEPGLNPFIAV